MDVAVKKNLLSEQKICLVGKMYNAKNFKDRK